MERVFNSRNVMKYVLLILSLTPCMAHAQEIQITRARQLNPDKAGDYSISGVSPDGKKLLVTGPGSKGLFLINIKNGKTQTITELPGAGHHPAFSSDGQSIHFQSDDFPNKRRVSTLHQADLTTGVISTPENKDQKITRPAISAVITPEGEGSRIWVSQSPDQTKTVYHLVGKGTFICGPDGKILASPGKINAPKWLNNQIIIGMDDDDDGHTTTASEIVAYDVTTGEKAYLTSTGNCSEMYPYPFPNGKKIAFRTADGKLFIAKVRIRK